MRRMSSKTITTSKTATSETATSKTATAIAAIAAAVVAVAGSPAAAAEPAYAHRTAVGVHNTYDKAKYAHLAQALDTGTSLIELDVYADTFPVKQWRVNHELVGQSNNCTSATTAAQLYTGSQNQKFDTCLANLKLWHDAHPNHPLIVVKVELKVGFMANKGLGPAEFDALVKGKLGSALYTPAELRTKPDGTRYATLDAAALADNWGSALGKFLFEIIPGTVERGNPFDALPTDVEYGRWLRDRSGDAAAFPAVLDAASGDPRTRFGETTIRPWFVFFDGDAATYVNGIDTAWYDTRHYLLNMTDASNVAPAIDATNPAPGQAQARVALLAARHATVASTDWVAGTGALATVLSRG